MKISIEERDDWMTIKVDGEIFYEGHRPSPIDWIDLLKLVGSDVDHKYIKD